MAGRYEVEVTIESARDLKNVNWRNGDLRPYVVVWIESSGKATTKVDVDGGCNPTWDEKLLLHTSYLDDAVIHFDIVHADASDGVKPLVGSAKLPLREAADEVGVGGKYRRSLQLKRPSGRPHGLLDVKVAVNEPSRYYAPPPSYAPSYPASSGSRDYGYGYAPPPPQPAYAPYGAAPPSTGYSYGYAQPAPPVAYQGYGQPPVAYQGYGQPPPAVYEEKKKSKMGMGTGLAVGAAAGVLGGLALAEGVDYVEDKIEDDVAEKVEDDLRYDDDGDYGGDDF